MYDFFQHPRLEKQQLGLPSDLGDLKRRAAVQFCQALHPDSA